jgi:hypothetical protein
MSDAAVRTGVMTERTVEGIREVLAGKMRWSSPLLFAGPAVIASIAYMDPGKVRRQNVARGEAMDLTQVNVSPPSGVFLEIGARKRG